MATKNFKGAPFGSQTARFDVSGVHPKSKRPGTYTQMPYDRRAVTDLNRKLGPGAYNVDVEGFSEKAMLEKADGPGWARAYEVARMASLPHLLHKEQWELKRLLAKRLGPGSYEFEDFLQAAERKPRSTHGICQTRAPRFKSENAENIPGPGTYGMDGIPHKLMEEKQKISPSTVGMLDAGGAGGRTLPQVGSSLAPGTYNFTSFTEDLLKKSGSSRGPYDLFTGERNNPQITGHYAVPRDMNLGPGQYNTGTFTDELTSLHNKKKGKFGTVAQYPKKTGERLYMCTLSQMPRDPDEPSPDKYDPKNPSDIHYKAKKLPGFLSSSQRNDRMAQKFFTRNFNPVGAGRYDIQKWEESRHINSHESDFKSKTQRPNHATEKFLKERIRAKDLRPEDKIYIVEPEVVPESYKKASDAATKYMAQRAAMVS